MKIRGSGIIKIEFRNSCTGKYLHAWKSRWWRLVCLVIGREYTHKISSHRFILKEKYLLTIKQIYEINIFIMLRENNYAFQGFNFFKGL